jgi:hypothetical protein
MTSTRKRTLIVTAAILTLFILLFVFITYSSYLDLKKTFVDRISRKATGLFGQEVIIGDFSFGPGGEIAFYDIVIRNPEGFGPGELLKIKRLSLDLKWRDLFRGRVSLGSIEIRSPVLTLVGGEKGILNVSDELKRFLSKKGTTKYQVHEFRIRSGNVSLNNATLYAARDIDLSVKNLSSLEDAKTVVRGTLSYVGNAVSIEGWAYPNRTDRNFNISVSSGDFTFSVLREALEKYGVETDKMRADLRVSAEGDIVKGCKIIMQTQFGRANFFSLFKSTKDIRLEGSAFLDLEKNSVTVDDLSIYADGGSSMRLKGLVAGTVKGLSYSAEIGIDKIDLSRFNLMKGIEISGEVRSDAIEIKGRSGEIPEVSGSMTLKGGTVRSSDISVEQVKGELVFSKEGGTAFSAIMSARIEKLRDYLAEGPVDAVLSVRATGRPEKIAVISGLHLSPLKVRTGGGTLFSVGGLDSSVEGTLAGDLSFAGKARLEMKSLAYAENNFPGLVAGFDIAYQENLVSVRDLKIDSERIKASLESMDVRTDKKGASYAVRVSGMGAMYPEKELVLNSASLVLDLRRDRKGSAGHLVFSAGEIIFQGIRSKAISGNAHFDEKEFSVDVSGADAAGGSVTLNALGKVPKGPFPVKAEIDLRDIDLGDLSRASLFRKLPCSVTGSLKRAALSGILDSPVSLQGRVAVEAKNLSFLKQDSKETILKGLELNSEAACSGRDCAFKADLSAGSIRTSVTGEVKGFAEDERSVSAKMVIPETKIAEARNSLWDSFPDKLLYAGLDGSLSAEVVMEYGGKGTKASGEVRLKDILIEGENGEYSAGPINGTVPFLYDTSARGRSTIEMPAFEKSEFPNLRKYYSGRAGQGGAHRITIGSLRYGFRLLDSIDVTLIQGENVLNIPRLGANIFGGRLNGSASVDFSDRLMYRAGILLEGLSLRRLCDEIEPIRGYISGKVDGVAMIKGTGVGMAGLIGKADFWTYGSGEEKMKISREFLQKVGGTSLKSYLGDRSYDKGEVSLYLQNGYAIFSELEISNRNLIGVRDLSVKVAPLNNRIEVGHLLWTITEAARRAKEKK